MLNSSTRWVVVGAMIAVIAGHAGATEILVDFGGSGLVPTLGGTWNTISSVGSPLTTVLDSSGNVVPGVSMQTLGWTDTDQFNDTFYVWGKDWADPAAVMDFYYIRMGSMPMVRVSGLPRNRLYDVEIVASSEPANGSWTADYKLNFDLAVSPPSDGSSAAFDPEYAGMLERKILRWWDVPLNSSGELVLTIHTKSPDYQGMLNAMRIIPEPTSAIVILAGLGACLIRRRRS